MDLFDLNLKELYAFQICKPLFHVSVLIIIIIDIFGHSVGYSIFFSLQVGDVVLVQDESVMENEFKMVGLETLVCSIVSSLT